MTMTREDPTLQTALIVVFDMCSSSNIIEDLTLTGNIKRLRDFMISLKNWLRKKAKQIGFSIYKFTGDGWILLFSPNIEGQQLVDFIVELSKFYDKTIKKQILPYLETGIDKIGLTFGIEKGQLIKMIMVDKPEFIGRSLNIACRLQNAVKDKGSSPEYRALVSNQVYNEYLKKVRDLKIFHVDRVLHNIRGGTRYKCVRWNLSSFINP